MNEIKRKANALFSTTCERAAGMYVKKTDRISQCHKKRENLLRRETVEIRKEYEERKQKHAQQFSRLRQEEELATAELEAKLVLMASRGADAAAAANVRYVDT